MNVQSALLSGLHSLAGSPRARYVVWTTLVVTVWIGRLDEGGRELHADANRRSGLSVHVVGRRPDEILFVHRKRSGGPSQGQAASQMAIGVMTFEGRDRRELYGSKSLALDPIWSRDRSRVAFVGAVTEGGRRTELFSMRADGTGVRRLTNHSQRVVCTSPSWSPDASQIVYSTFGLDRSDEAPELWVVEVATGRSRLLEKGTCPDWSPDGRTVLFTRPETGFIAEGRLWAFDLRTNSSKRVIGQMTTCGGSWSPDGRQIAYSVVRQDQRGTVWVAKADGTQRRQLTKHEGPPREYGEPIWTDVTDREPRWSADGSSLAFNRCENVAMNGVAERSRIWKVPVRDGSPPRPISPDDGWDMLGGGALVAPFWAARG
jgi:Tol biopolymer transport system component